MRPDPYFDPEDYNGEVTCECRRHQGECDGPPLRCCERCIHWIPVPSVTEPGDVFGYDEWKDET